MFTNAGQALERGRKAFPRLVWAGVAVLFVLVLGAMLMSAGAAGLAWTNTESFCISCHEMRDNVYAEYKDSVHDRNRSGVRAICSDCHVPRDPVPMLERKTAATFELWAKLAGKIDTREKFEAHRAELAQRVWRTMLANDSRECRNCHTDRAMDVEKQSRRAANRHEKARQDGTTCIVCHYGIAHEEPDGPSPSDLIETSSKL
jgi:cytochrome c-type protein NapC